MVSDTAGGKSSFFSPDMQPQLSRRKMPLLMALITRAVVDETKRQGSVNLDELGNARLVKLLPGGKMLQKPLKLWKAVAI